MLKLHKINHDSFCAANINGPNHMTSKHKIIYPGLARNLHINVTLPVEDKQVVPFRQQRLVWVDSIHSEGGSLM